MSKPAATAFPETDFSKFMDMSKLMDATKAFGEFKMPTLNVEALVAVHRKNMEAITSANQVAIEGFQALARRQAELAKQSFEATTSMVQAVTSAQTPEEKVACQAEATKATMGRCLSSLKELTDVMTRNQYQAMELVSNRVCESMDELQGIIKSSR